MAFQYSAFQPSAFQVSLVVVGNVTMPQMIIDAFASNVPAAGDADLSVSFIVADDNAYSGMLASAQRVNCVISNGATTFTGVIQ